VQHHPQQQQQQRRQRPVGAVQDAIGRRGRSLVPRLTGVDGRGRVHQSDCGADAVIRAAAAPAALPEQHSTSLDRDD